MKLAKMMKRVGNLCLGLVFLSALVSQILAFAVFKLDGEYAWSEIPMPVRYSMLAVGFFLLAAFVFWIGSVVVRSLVSRAVLAKGQAAMARILRISDTGAAINDDPVVGILLEVYPPGQSPFRAEVEQLVSRFQIFQVQPGTLVQVKCDPDSHAVAIMPEVFSHPHNL